VLKTITQCITNAYNNFKYHEVYCYGTPMDSKAQLSKSQCPAEGSAEASQMKDMPYRELIGSLLWVANGTRPDVSFAVNTLAKFTSNPGLKLEGTTASSWISVCDEELLHKVRA
jgi:hypothetical protein